MTRPPEITDVRCTPGSDAERRRGLVAYVAFRVGGDLLVDGCTVRRTRERRLRLSFPTRRGPGGRTHPLLRPTCEEARARIERRIFDELGLDPAPRDGGGR